MAPKERQEVIAIISADSSQLDPALAKSRKKVRGWAKGITVDVKRTFAGIGDIVGLGGMAGLLMAGKRVMEFQTRLVRLRQSSNASAEAMVGLEKKIFKLAEARGLNTEDILAGAEKFVQRTGNLQGYVDGMAELGKVSAATGTSMEELALIGATLDSQLGVKSKDWGIAFDLLARQGEAGAVELSSMAAEVTNLLPLWKRFGKQGVDGLASLGAMLQMTMSGFGGQASEARTGLESLMGSILKNAKKLKGKGIKIFEKDERGKTRIRGVLDILKQIQRKSKGSLVKLQDFIGSDKESTKSFLAIMDKVEEGSYEDLIDQTKAAGTVASDAKIWDESPAAKMAKSMAKLEGFFNESLKNHIDDAAQAMSTFASALQLAAKNAHLIIAAFGGKKLIEILAGSGGGSGLKGLIEASIGGGKDGAPTGIGKGARGGKIDRFAGAVVGFGTGYELGQGVNSLFGLTDSQGDSAIGLEAAAKASRGNEDKLYDLVLAQARRETGMQGGAVVGQRQRELEVEAGLLKVGKGGGLQPLREGEQTFYGSESFKRRRAEARKAVGVQDGFSPAAAALSAGDEALQAALAKSGLQASQLTPEQYAGLRGKGAAAALEGGLTPQEYQAGGAASSAIPELVKELKKLRATIEQQGGAKIQVEQDMRAVRRRGG